MKKLSLLLLFFLAACGSAPQATPAATGTEILLNRQENIPQTYQGLQAPANASIEAGKTVYDMHCAKCHGETGMGETGSNSTQNPAASPLALTGNLHSDAYLYWRISEGGASFQTSMPGWKGTLSEGEIWETIAYVRALGNSNNPQAEAVKSSQEDLLLENAIQAGLLTADEAKRFRDIRTALKEYMRSHPDATDLNTAMQSLQTQGVLTQSQVEEFQSIQERLRKSGYLQ